MSLFKNEFKIFSSWSKENNLHNLFINISNILKASNFVLYVIPLFAAIDHIFYVKILALTALAEYSTLILKWLIPEIRPYWWMKENEHLMPSKIVLLNGYTHCEPSSGFPSGHTLLVTVMMYIIVKFYRQKIDRYR